jgi:hypothetical protein
VWRHSHADGGRGLPLLRRPDESFTTRPGRGLHPRPEQYAQQYDANVLGTQRVNGPYAAHARSKARCQSALKSDQGHELGLTRINGLLKA